MKRSLSLILALLMVLTSMSFEGLKAEAGPKYVLQASGEDAQEFDEADALVDAINAIANDETKSYTLTLNADLVLPVLEEEKDA